VTTSLQAYKRKSYKADKLASLAAFMRCAVDISFVIVNWNTRELLIDCLHSLQNAVGSCRYEVFVVDNGSRDGSPDAVRRRFGHQVQLIANSENLGFARANNQALRRATGTYIVLLNSDTILQPDTIQGLIAFLDRHAEAAMVGPRMIGGDGRLQNSYDNFPCLATELLNKSVLRMMFPGRFSGKSATASEPFEVDSLIGACVAVRRKALEEVGLFDEDYFFFLEETDWCLRMRKAGWKIVHHPGVSIVHLQGQSKKRRPSLAWIEYYRSLYTFFKKHRSRSAYTVLRIFRFLKLVVNLLLTVCGLCCTLGIKQRYRDKTIVYGRLVWWHLRLCPAGVGLKGSRQ